MCYSPQYNTYMHIIGPAGQQTYRAIVLINPTTATAPAPAILPNLKTKIVITQSIFKLGP